MDTPRTTYKNHINRYERAKRQAEEAAQKTDYRVAKATVIQK
ncbi:MAG: hypothetical protein PUI94_04880 [Eubacteriales bacterium]|nr:hypothetical protein [Eubacteriales bacterium]